MSERNTMESAAIRELCRPLHLPTIATHAVRMAEQAVKEKLNHLGYLEALLAAEVEERQQNAAARRIKEARFPKAKTLEDFDFQIAQHLPVAQIRQLSEGGYISRNEPIIFVGETRRR